MKVCKFGGSSCASAGQIKKVCDIVLSDAERKIIVVSAPGKRTEDDAKVTDLLITLANAVISGYDGLREKEAVLSRFAEIANDLGLDAVLMQSLEANLNERLSHANTNRERFMDLMKAAGEDFSARLFAAYLQQVHGKATYLHPSEAGLYLSAEFGNAQVLPESYDNLASLVHRDGILVIPGFFGVTKGRRNRHVPAAADPTSADPFLPRPRTRRCMRTGPMSTRSVP